MRFAALILGCAALSAGATGALAQTRVVAGVGLQGSESARYDTAGDRIIVANLGARGDGDDGFVSLLTPDGVVTNLKWIEGGKNGAELRDPFGVFIKGETVYLADVHAIRTFDRRSGAAKASFPIDGSVRLNDLAVADDGTMYVTDSGSDDHAGAIYKISAAGEVSTFAARDPALERPNGIAIMSNGNIVHGGRGVNLVVRTPQGQIIREITLPYGRMDGIVALPDGALLVASQDGHNVYYVPATGKPTVVASDIAIPAAIGLDTRRNRLIIPQIAAASVTLVDLP